MHFWPRLFTLSLFQEASYAAVSRPLTGSGALPEQAVARRSSITDSSKLLVLPQHAKNATERAAAINTTRLGFLYGPPVGGGPYYPTGSIGNATALADLASLQAELDAQRLLVAEDSSDASNSSSVVKAVNKYGGLDTLEDYTLLYADQWTETLPNGPVQGILTNYTQDLLFSMERLSHGPYSIRRLDPSSDNTLPFAIDDPTIEALSGGTWTLEGLFQQGRLFYANHSLQATLDRTAGRYAAACDAYFYIDESSGDFLPLAVRSAGNGLVYTPRDDASDWLLAKMMFNANDVFFTQFNHLASTHEVVQIVWMAAIRTLSVDHPVYALLNRLAYQTFGVNPVAQSLLFDNGTAVDKTFGFTGSAARQFTDHLYNGGAGAFRANYFLQDLKARGLINSTFGPALPHFPFYEDGLVIYEATRLFVESFVDSYYDSDDDVTADTELQAWTEEANGPAQVMDFPSSFADKQTLVDVLSHFAHLVSTSHHAVNTNELQSISATLPLHPWALYKPVPTSKGNTSVVSFLPPLSQCIQQISVSGAFSRPLLADTNRTLLHMFDDKDMLSRTNEQTVAAAETFKSTMQAFSEVFSARAFDSDGLCQGMPFVWKALDPNVAPYSATI